jgi:hypothetical protein
VNSVALAVAAAAVAIAVAVTAGCRNAPAPPEASPAPTAKPVDHLAENELPEGRELAFGFPLPASLKVVDRGTESVECIDEGGAIRRERIANYVRAHVKDGVATVGAARTLFTGVHVGSEKRPLDIDVSQDNLARTHLRVYDRSTKPIPTYATEAERWKAAVPTDHVAGNPQFE